MWYQRMKIEERRLLGRESAWQWELVHDRGYRWLALLIALAAIAGIYLAFQSWLYGSVMLP